MIDFHNDNKTIKWSKTKRRTLQTCSNVPYSCRLVLEVFLPALLMVLVVVETQGGPRVGLMVWVCAGREAAWARGWRGQRSRPGPGAGTMILSERAVGMSAGADECRVEVTLLAAERLGLNGGRRCREVSQGAILGGHAPIVTGPHPRPASASPGNVVITLGRWAIISRCRRRERVTAVDDVRGDGRPAPTAANWISTRLVQSHAAPPLCVVGQAGTLSHLCGTKKTIRNTNKHIISIHAVCAEGQKNEVN